MLGMSLFSFHHGGGPTPFFTVFFYLSKQIGLVALQTTALKLISMIAVHAFGHVLGDVRWY